MDTLYIKRGEKLELPKLVATVGFFDGVHLGHQYLIRHVVNEAKQSGMQSAVITFDLAPRQVVLPNYQPQLLSSLSQKMSLLSHTHVDKVIVLHFDKELASLSASKFMEDILRNQLNVQTIIIGYDNRFGRNRSEGFDDFVRYGSALGIKVLHNDAYLPSGEKISSSTIREEILQGNLEGANQRLGYEYTFEGEVVSGFQNGRKLGFPTANLDVTNPQQLIPGNGVYAVLVRLEENSDWKRGMMNIGVRPTFDGTKVSMEVNIFNFDGDLYGKTISVKFISKIRNERKFDSLTALTAQLSDDKVKINRFFDQR